MKSVTLLEKSKSLRRVDSTYKQGGDGKQKQVEPFDVDKYNLYGMSERDIYLYKEVFNIIDVNETGLINPNELRAALLSFGIYLSKSDLYNLVCDYDEEEIGGLTFKDFMDIITKKSRPYTQDNPIEYKRAFKKLSGNKDLLTVADLEKNLTTLGLVTDDAQMERLVKKAGGKDGSITFEGFYAIVTEFIKNNQDTSVLRFTKDIGSPVLRRGKSIRFDFERQGTFVIEDKETTTGRSSYRSIRSVSPNRKGSP